ncbi:MAG: hypothetical protein DSY33_02530 [Archaeoglobus sp.]|jgi:predicted Rossmann fold nucleotide-binding protein DprA/Smf involved in DNA uptake|nr:MAG: hypothetical protein DSY33_02530 [Archaeoglobus sp.]
MSCIFCKYFSSCGGRAEICEHFELKEPKERRTIERTVNESMTIREAAERLNMTVTEFLEMLGQMEREGKIKIEIR